MSEFYLLNEVKLGSTMLRPGQLVSDMCDDVSLLRDAGGVLVSPCDSVVAAAAAARGIRLKGGEPWRAFATMLLGYMFRGFAGPMNWADFDSLDEAPAYREGRVYHMANVLNTMTEFPGVTIQNGEELQIPIVNKDTIDLPNGTPVYSHGKQGQRLAVKRPDSSDPSTWDVLGLLTHLVPLNQNGRCTSFGLVRDLDTSMWSVDDKLYVNGLGILSNTRPTQAGHYAARVADVVASHPQHGILTVFVRVDMVIAGLIRPSVPRVGEEFFDTNLGLPIWWDGGSWVDAAGVVR